MRTSKRRTNELRTPREVWIHFFSKPSASKKEYFRYRKVWRRNEKQ
jgi:hypothetical protein